MVHSQRVTLTGVFVDESEFNLLKLPERHCSVLIVIQGLKSLCKEVYSNIWQILLILQPQTISNKNECKNSV